MSATKLHSDNESSTMDQNNPICNVSLGTTRKLNLFRKDNTGRQAPVISTTILDRSLTIMKAGCQQVLNHVVPVGNVPGIRYSLSFRHVSTDSDMLEKACISSNSTENTVENTKINEKAKTSLILGTSIQKHLDGKRLAKGVRKCINLSGSRYTITKSANRSMNSITANQITSTSRKFFWP